MSTRFVCLLTVCLCACALPASAASIEKSIDLKRPADQVWSLVGPFCSIKDWHPAIGTCSERDGVRTLTTKDGKATFIERQTVHDDKDMTYSYVIQKGPLPVTEYTSTLKIVSKGDKSTVQWSSTYTPEEGKEQAAETAITGIYQAGLDNIQKLVEH